MSDATHFDFPMSRTFREGLPIAIDYRASKTFLGPTRRRPTTPQFRDQELDALQQQIRGWRSTALYWQERARRAEEEIRARSARQELSNAITFDGPEAPLA